MQNGKRNVRSFRLILFGISPDEAAFKGRILQTTANLDWRK